MSMTSQYRIYTGEVHELPLLFSVQSVDIILDSRHKPSLVCPAQRAAYDVDSSILTRALN